MQKSCYDFGKRKVFPVSGIVSSEYFLFAGMMSSKATSNYVSNAHQAGAPRPRMVHMTHLTDKYLGLLNAAQNFQRPLNYIYGRQAILFRQHLVIG